MHERAHARVDLPHGVRGRSPLKTPVEIEGREREQHDEHPRALRHLPARPHSLPRDNAQNLRDRGPKLRCPAALLLLELYLEKFRPELARHEEAVALLVVGDAVQDGLLVRNVAGLEQAREVYPTGDVPIPGVYARYTILMPDVRVNLALNVFELVDLKDRAARVPDAYRALHL